MDRSELERALTVAWNRQGIDGASLQLSSDGTIAAPSAHDGEEELPLLVSLEEGTSFAMGRTIGEGGMGLVRAAQQRDLQREVAVKMLRTKDSRAVSELLREARVIGALEHPNVVPVHALGRDAHGQPAIVMKRIEGTSWRDVLDAEGREPLDRHLNILVQVARAMHFVHRRGVLHRDLKPDNVMLGEFGEVYIVDWGLAVALRECAVVDLRSARDVKHVAGTPQYMAPEMVVAAGELFGPPTDVYLLGATLHELLVGSPPHAGRDLRSVLAHAYESAPKSYPAEVPAELAAIATRAMHPDPHARFPDADALAAAIDAYREHKSAIEVSREAQKSLEQLERHITGGAPRERIHEAFSESRFGFQQSLRMWPENRDAREGLQHALATMIRFELDNDSPEAAEVLLHELPEERTDLARDVEHALAARRSQQQRLVKLEREHDPTAGDRGKALLVLIQAATWPLVGLSLAYVHHRGLYTIRPGHLGAIQILSCLAAAVVVAKWQSRLFDTKRQRHLAAFGVGATGAYGLLYFVAHLIDASLYEAIVFMHVAAILAWFSVVVL
ncbi:MAG TPA: serine/threonine-protein kinase, partial [Polyangiaceae bacterium]|nr:serine/threonine-protein kinase [Polyangiaceae bacterium]